MLKEGNMIELTQEQMNYLLYTKAYAKTEDAETVTNGTVKSHLIRDVSSDIYDVGVEVSKTYYFLLHNLLITLATKDGNPTKKKGRFLLTEEGNKVLLYHLAQTDYRFTSAKGCRVLNTLLACIQEVSKISPQSLSSSLITLDEFREKFKEFYFLERRVQERQGLVTMYKNDLCQRFSEKNLIPLKVVEDHFERLKDNDEILVIPEQDVELVQWIE